MPDRSPEQATADLGSLHERLRGHDRFFLELESSTAALNVGGLVRLAESDPDSLVEDLRRVMAARIHLMPRLRQRLVEVDLKGAPPLWVDDPNFDLQRVVRNAQLPQVPDRPAVLALAGQLVSEPLARQSCLWDLTVIGRTTFGESAVVARWHHALVDGMSSIEFGKLLFSPTPDMELTDPQPWSPEPTPSPAELAAESMALMADDQLRELLEKSVAGEEPEDQLQRFERFVDGLLSFLDLGSMPPNPFPPSSAQRRYGTASVSASNLRLIQKRFDLTLEAAVYLVFSTAVHELLAARGSGIDTLRVMLPVARISRSRSKKLGNHGSFNIVDLPVGPMEVAERAGRIGAELKMVRASKQAEAAASLIRGAEKLPSAVSTRLGQWTNSTTFVHGIISYMRGPRRQLYIAGREHLGIYPLLPRTSGLGLLVGVMNLGGYVSFGLVADPVAVPDLNFLARAIERVGGALLPPSAG